MPSPRELDQLWRGKSDDELLEAAGSLGEYTPDAQRIIREELKRRGFEDPVEQRGESALEATGDGPPPRECDRCHVEMKFLGSRLIPAAEWTTTGEVPEVDGASFEMYMCPECTRVETFLNLPAEEEEEEA